ncbi:hypothetical protein L596_030457 [Steinernema carpocapsae]|uniref:Uncharacterized protein n=1 Tax=Steinernema carpocapsae TaxID=34508 RepID=A0A4U5LPF7_STECR|nr:hypothetical protein L596_030457 [Steinernema carpocapsae]
MSAIFALFLLVLEILRSAYGCCDSCENDVISFNHQLTGCLKELTEKKLQLKVSHDCDKAKDKVGYSCTANLMLVTTSLGDCLESLCEAKPIKPELFHVNVSVNIGVCEQAESRDPFTISFAKLDGPKLIWISRSASFPGGDNGQVYNLNMELSKKQIREATHVLMDITGADDVFIKSINVTASTGAKVSFSQPDNCDCNLWVTADPKNDQKCKDYLKINRSITLFGKNGVENVLSVEDFEKLKQNELETLHGQCSSCIVGF